ncbi:MAG TPA: hypothetical protein VEB66_14485 [Opitutaceae bacterium]|nr:hypothetical protein [Opitutaceae bacterium]
MMLPRLAGLLAALALALPAPAAINPAEYQRVASHHLRLRELARVVHAYESDSDRLRRVTVVALVVEELDSNQQWAGKTIVIDYAVNLTRREAAAREFQHRQGNMPGPQFMSEPEPPALDDKGEFWAHLAPLGGRLGNVNRHAGAVVGIGDYQRTPNVFVPVAGQYSFQPPM